MLSLVQLFMPPWTAACQAPLTMVFSRQEYCNGEPFPSPGDLPNPGNEPRYPAVQGSFGQSCQGSPKKKKKYSLTSINSLVPFPQVSNHPCFSISGRNIGSNYKTQLLTALCFFWPYCTWQWEEKETEATPSLSFFPLAPPASAVLVACMFPTLFQVYLLLEWTFAHSPLFRLLWF